MKGVKGEKGEKGVKGVKSAKKQQHLANHRRKQTFDLIQTVG